MEGLVAAVLLIGGGLTTLQTASVTTGLPFALVLLIGVYSLYVGFSEELYVENAVERAVFHAKEEQRVHEVVEQVVNEEGDDSAAPARTS
jgi:choline/glycine/proline betaine transport protein